MKFILSVAAMAIVIAGCTSSQDNDGKTPHAVAEDSSATLTPTPVSPAPDSSATLILTPAANSAAESSGTVEQIATASPDDSSSASESGDQGSSNSVEAVVSTPEELHAALTTSPSPYLRAAASSPVKWMPYSVSALAAAKSANKPVLVCLGSNSLLNSRLMDREAFADAGVADTLNKSFTALRVDRELQPDVYRRYSQAYELINRTINDGQLTAFALADGRPFDILGYIPAQGAGDSAGMSQLLKQVLDLYGQNKDELQKQAKLIEKRVADDAPKARPLTADVLNDYTKVAKAALADPAQVMQHAMAAKYLLQRVSDVDDKSALEAASSALLEKFRSSQRDQVLGGYFASADLKTTPRYEKTLAMQSGLLSDNALAFAATNKPLHKEAAEEILRFLRDTLEAPDGGFYASQDAEAGTDQSAYFAWSGPEIQNLVGDTKEAKAFIKYLNAGDTRGPLQVTGKLQGAADAAGLDYEAALKALNDVRMKLRDARMQQEQVPYVNKCILASWNAEMINAYLDAYKYLGDTKARDFALKSADYMITHMVSETQGVAHACYKNQPSDYGHLEDNVGLASALIECFQVSGQSEYLDSAKSIMQYANARFYNEKAGLFSDHAPNDALAGMLQLQEFPLNDRTVPSGNAVAAEVLYDLGMLESSEEYAVQAKRTVEAAAGSSGWGSASAASMARVGSCLIHPPPKVLIIATPGDSVGEKMRASALPVFRMGKLVELISPEDAAKTAYTPDKEGKALAYVCTAKNCAPPTRDADKLADLVKTFGKSSSSKAADTEGAPSAP